MNVTRFKDAPAYFPAEHFDMRCLRLQGHEAGPATQLWMGMSQILPGGHITPSASPIEKIYFVVEGELTVETPEGAAVLQAYDSCRIVHGESCALHNKTNRPVMVVLAMPLEPPK